MVFPKYWEEIVFYKEVMEEKISKNVYQPSVLHDLNHLLCFNDN